MPNRFNVAQCVVIDQSARPMASAGNPLSVILNELYALIDAGSIGITSEAIDVDSIALGGGEFSQDPDTTAGLVFGYQYGRFHNGMSLVNVSSGTLTLGASVTNYVEVDRSGTVSFNNSGFTAGRLPLYVVVTGASDITAVTSAKALMALIGIAGVTGQMLSAAAGTKVIEIPLGGFSSTTSFLVICPNTAATLVKASFANSVSIATDPAAQWAFGMVNKGPGGSGTTAMLDTGAVNSTATSGGSAITAYVARDLTLNSTSGNLDTAAGDVLVFTVSSSSSPTAIAGAVLRLEFSFEA